ncbi:MAG: histidine kinase [Saprospiraceae bacterium]
MSNINSQFYNNVFRDKRIYYFILSCFLLVGFGACQLKKKPAAQLARIIEIQEKYKPSEVKLNLTELEESEALLQNLASVPDSFRAENQYLLGRFYKSIGDKKKASLFYYEAIEYTKDSIRREREHKYFEWAISIFYDIEDYGNLEVVKKRYKNLLEKEKEKNYSPLAGVYFYEENAYQKQGNYEAALKSSALRIEMSRLAGASEKMNIPSALISRAESLFKLKRKEKAFAILDTLITEEADLSANDKRQLYGNYGTYLFFDEKYEAALAYYLKGLSYTHAQQGGKKYLPASYGNIAGGYLELGNYKKASSYLDSLEALGINTIDTDLADSYFKYRLRVAYETGQSIDLLLNELDTVVAFQRNLRNNQLGQELLALEKTYNEKEILQAENQKSELNRVRMQSFLIALGVIFLLSLLGTFYFYRQRRKKFEQEGLLMQQRLLRSQMSPHFIFNFLYATQNQIRENPNIAIQHLTKFSRLLRLILENSMLNYVQLDKELESLRKYLDLQRVRFPEKFSYEIILENLEEDEFIFIPPMLLQPIVENCIEHGFAEITYPGKIILRMTQEAKYISCVVEDNGIGLQQSNQNQSKQSSAMRLISDFLKKTVKQEIKIIDKASVPNAGTGVEVKLLIPYKLTED